MHCILVVDDEDMTRATFGMALRHHNMKVWEARNVTQALELIDAFEFSAILCDILLPDGDGEDVLEAVHQKNPRTPVIMMTGFPTNKSRQRSQSLCAFAYLKKPITIQKMVQVVLGAIGNDQLESLDPKGDDVVPDSEGLEQVYPVPLTLEERELIKGMIMHQLNELEEYHTSHAVEGKRILNSALSKMRRLM